MTHQAGHEPSNAEIWSQEMISAAQPSTVAIQSPNMLAKQFYIILNIWVSHKIMSQELITQSFLSK